MKADALDLNPVRSADPVAWLLYGLAALVVVGGLAVATTLRPIWMVLIIVGIATGTVLLALPEKKLVLWSIYLLTLPLSAGKWVTVRPEHFFGENPAGLVMFISDLPLFLLLAWWLADIALGKSRVVVTPLLKPWLCWLVWRALTVVVAHDKSMAIWNVYMHAKFFMTFLWVSSNITDRRWIFATAGLCMVDLLVQSGFNITSFFVKGAVTVFGIIRYTTQSIGGEAVFRATGTMGPHNSQTHFYEMTVPLAAIVLYYTKSWWIKAVSLVALAGGLVSTVTTFSRGGWLGVMIAFLLATFLLYRNKLLGTGTFAIMVIVGALAGAGFLLGPPNIISKRLTEPPRVASTSRWHMMGVGLRMVAHHPLMGVGTNNAAGSYERYFPNGVPWECWYPVEDKKYIIPIHNKYLLIAAEHGLVGLGLATWLMFTAYQCASRCMRSSDSWLKAFGGWMIATFTAMLAHLMLSEFSHGTVLEMFFFMISFLAGMWVAAEKLDREAPAEALAAVRAA